MDLNDGFWPNGCPGLNGGDDDLVMPICSLIALICIVVGIVFLCATALPKLLGILLIAVPVGVMGLWAMFT